MKKNIFSLLIIVALIFIIPPISAQEVSFADKANQKSVEVKIDKLGKIQVTHIIDSSNVPNELELIDGTISNLSITNENGEETLTTIGENNSILISPSRSDSIIKYNVEDILSLKNDYWTLDFLYLESTKFIIPEDLKSFYINNKIVMLNEQRGFICHGCQMLLEYSFEEPKTIHHVEWQDQEFDVEVMSFAKINNFIFDQPSKSLTLDIIGDNKFVTILIPLELLWEPYTVLHNDEKIQFRIANDNGTHVWLNMRPDASGEINIIGTTVVPEFSIIAPLAIGFLMLLALPFVKKFNLH